MQELSFIKKEYGNASDFFIDSFLQDHQLQLDSNADGESVLLRGADNLVDENLLQSLHDPAGLFKEVEAQEFDFDECVQTDNDVDVEVLKRMSEATRNAALQADAHLRGASRQQPDSGSRCESEPGSGMFVR